MRCLNDFFSLCLLQSRPEEEEEQEANSKLQKAGETKTGIKTEAADIKEETKLMTVEDDSEKLGTMTRYVSRINVGDLNLDISNKNITFPEGDPKEEDENVKSKSEPLSSPLPVDWKPQDKCYYCVDGKLLKLNEIGELVVEAGPVQPEAELNKHVSHHGSRTCDSTYQTLPALQIIESDDSSSSSDATHKPIHHHNNHPTSSFIPKSLEALLKTISVGPNMTSLESRVAAQLAAFQQLQSAPELNHMNPFYPSRFRVREISADVIINI